MRCGSSCSMHCGRQKREQSFLELKQTEKTEGETPDIERILEVLVSENLEKEPGYDKIEQGLMIRILQHLCRDYTLQLHSDSREGREKVFLYELECFIRTNAASVTAAKLEEKFHYHRNYYSLILKKYRGQVIPPVCDRDPNEILRGRCSNRRRSR